MTSVTPEFYAKIASCVLEAVRDRDFFNGRIECTHEAYEVTLVCTLIVYRKKKPDGLSPGPLDRVVPVWWRCLTMADGGERDNDFGWSELAPYLY